MRALDAGDWRERELVARDQPVEEFREGAERPIGKITATAGGDAIDQVDHFALADAIDRATAPCRQHDPVEHALGSPGGRGPGLAVGVELQERGHRRLDRTPTPSRSARYTRYRRYGRRVGRARLQPVAMGRCRRARSSERETAVAGATECSLDVDTVVTEAECPATRAARLDDEVEPGTTSVRILGARRLWPNRFDEPVGDDFSHHCILPRGVKG